MIKRLLQLRVHDYNLVNIDYDNDDIDDDDGDDDQYHHYHLCKLLYQVGKRHFTQMFFVSKFAFI